jgi:DNA-binding response OmpR family regulator
MEVLQAASPDDAVAAMRARRPDLVVTAFSPPRERGLRGIRAILSAINGGCPPVLALSTTAGDGDRDLLMREGIAGYLVKPCPPLTLLAEARRLLGA